MADFDFLTMSKHVAQMAGLSGNMGGVTGQVGDMGRVVRFVREATVYVESLYGDWKFLFGGFVPITLQAGLNTYSPPTGYDVYRWNKNGMTIDDQIILRKNVFEYHERRVTQGDLDQYQPMQVIIRPDNSLMFIGTPDKQYEFRGDYYKRPKILVNNTDVPNVPQQFCAIIEAEALRRYANYDNAAELKTEAQESYDMWLTLLEYDQKPGGTHDNTGYDGSIVIAYD